LRAASAEAGQKGRWEFLSGQSNNALVNCIVCGGEILIERPLEPLETWLEEYATLASGMQV
jgi:hypothetical protein